MLLFLKLPQLQPSYLLEFEANNIKLIRALTQSLTQFIIYSISYIVFELLYRSKVIVRTDDKHKWDLSYRYIQCCSNVSVKSI